MKQRVWQLFTLSRGLSRSQQWPMYLRSLSTAAPTATGCGSSGVAVKKVTSSNFDPALEELRALVRESDFVAVDLEFSGVASAPWREAFVFDDPEVQYLKVKDSADKFAVMQFGVCPFRWDHSKQSFLAHPHNFYLFQRKELPFSAHSIEFLCQTSSMDFLARHQFDFNACIHDGISFLSKAQETEICKEYSLQYVNKATTSGNKLESDAEIPLTRVADILFAERIKNRFLEWHDGILKGSATTGNGIETTFVKMRPAVLLDGFTSHQQYLIRMVIKAHFKDLMYTRINCETTEQKAVIYVASDDDKALLMKEVQEDRSETMKEKIRKAVGFRHVIDLLSTEKKLLVGHSCILDITHIHKKFIGPLPETITEFARALHKYFPHIVDTKHILRGNESMQYLMDRKGKSLSSIFAFLCPELSSSSQNTAPAYHQAVKVEVPQDKNGPSWNSGADHDAGYDAFMTGCVFAQLCCYLGIDFKLQSKQLDLLTNERLQAHMNLVYPNWKSETVIDLKTGTEVVETAITSKRGRCRKIDFSNFVLLWGFSNELKPIEMKECLCKVFGFDSVKSIFYLDGTAALVQFSKVELVGKFLQIKDSLERNNNVVSVLHPFAKILEGGVTRAAKYDAYREICRSSLSKLQFADQAEALGYARLTKLTSGDSEITESKLEASASSLESASEESCKDSVLLRSDHKSKLDSHLSSIIDSLHAAAETSSQSVAR